MKRERCRSQVTHGRMIEHSLYVINISSSLACVVAVCFVELIILRSLINFCQLHTFVKIGRIIVHGSLI